MTTTSLKDLVARIGPWIDAGCSSSFIWEEPNLCPLIEDEKPIPTLSWIRCDPSIKPHNIVDSEIYESCSSKSIKVFEAIIRDSVEGVLIEENTLKAFVQICAACLAVKRATGTDANDRYLSLASRFALTIPPWLAVRKRLSEYIFGKYNPKNGSNYSLALILLLFNEDRPDGFQVKNKVKKSSWEELIFNLDRYRQNESTAPLKKSIIVDIKRIWSDKGIKALSPIFGREEAKSKSTSEFQRNNLTDELRFFVNRSNRPITLLGPSGSGKTFLAEMIHEELTNTKGDFIAINCHAFTPTLLDAELFGVKEGAATNISERKGAFERAIGGTLFLDEVGGTSIEFQSKLLTAVESRRAIRVGGSEYFTFENVRLIFATNVDLFKDVEDGKFRHDLLYRMGRLFTIPSLSERNFHDFSNLVVKIFNEIVHSELIGKISTVEIPDSDFIKKMHNEAERLFPGQIRTLRIVLEDAILEAERNRSDIIKWKYIESASKQWCYKPMTPASLLTPKERLTRFKDLVLNGENDLVFIRRELGYPDTPEGTRRFHEWKSRNRDKLPTINKEDTNE